MMHCCSFLASLIPSRIASSPALPIASHARLHRLERLSLCTVAPHQEPHMATIEMPGLPTQLGRL